MASVVKTLVISGYGTNCETECAYAAKLAGAKETVVAHFSDLITASIRLPEFQFLIFPGGFLDGDDLGAAQAAAQRWKLAITDKGTALVNELRTFIKQGGLILGICNGFQLLVKLGLLPAFDIQRFERKVSLTHNASARYEDRWCWLQVNQNSPCVFTKNLSTLYIPVRHGEGRLVTDSPETMRQLHHHNLIPLQYSCPVTNSVTQEYPYNPNGSPDGIAGLCDPSGHIFGLMPHPEAYNHPSNHPGWTRGEQNVLGLNIFINAIDYLKKRNGQRL